MKISTEQLAQHLKRGLKPLYTVFGDETLLALEAADRIRASAREQGYLERELQIAEQHFDWSRLKASGAELSLFATRRILELRIPGGKPGNDGSQALQQFCSRLPEDTITLICLPAVDWRTQKGGWFAALEEAGVMIEANRVSYSELPKWLAGRLAMQQQQADEETLAFIAGKVEGNLLAAYQEVQKLGLLFPAGQLSFEAVKDTVLDVARFDVFDLGHVMLSGDASHLTRVLDGLQGEGAAPPLVLWSMAEEVRTLGRVLSATSGGRPLNTVWRELRIWGERQNLIQRHLSRFRMEQIEAALSHAARIDRMIKGLGSGDVWDELLQLGLRFAVTKSKSQRLAPAKSR